MRGHVIEPDVFRDVELDIEVSTPEESEVIFVGLANIIDDDFIDSYPQLQYIVCPTTSVDHIQISNPSIKIVHLDPDSIRDIRASSEFALLLILSLLRKSPGMFYGVDRSELVGEELYGKTLGILGNGRIGSHVGNYASAMGACVIAYDRNKERSSFSKREVLEQSDIVLLSISATPANRNYIASDELSLMKHGCCFVNISRWFTVDESRLLEYLQSGKIRVASDVVRQDSPLFDYDGDNLLITPHIAGSTRQSYKKACEYTLSKFKRMLK